MHPIEIQLHPGSSFLPEDRANPITSQALQEPGLYLFWGARTPARALLAAMTTLAASGAAPRLFDGGNRFDGYFVARLARRLSPDPEAILGRIRLSRAFTCFQLAELIENAPAGGGPTFVLDLLATFYDESVSLREVEQVLRTTIGHLKRLALAGPVVIGATEPLALVQARWGLLERLQLAADRTWLLRKPADETMLQMQLF